MTGWKWAIGSLAAAGLWAQGAGAQDIVIPNIIELSGGGATVGAMWKNGSSMAVEEINAAGGILGKKIKLEFVDTASDPGKARAAMQRALDDKPIAVFGPIYSGSVSATLKMTAEAEVPQIMGGEAGPLTAQGSKYLFRTSFGQNVSMPKIANYLRDGVKAKSVAVVFVNNDFGKGGRDAIIKELGGARHQGRGRRLDRGRPGRLRGRRDQGSRAPTPTRSSST
jgi:branched-chain amino acid transport system substrate-binding protein